MPAPASTGGGDELCRSPAAVPATAVADPSGINLPGSEEGGPDSVQMDDEPANGCVGSEVEGDSLVGNSSSAREEVMKINSEGYTRRIRIGASPEERELNPNRTSALEASIKNYAERKSDIVVNPVVGTSFDSLDDAYNFYNLYSWEIGFGVRYAKCRLNIHGKKCMQEIVCVCAGKPLTENSRSACCSCTVLIRLLRSEDKEWYICEHRERHNHPLFKACDEKLQWKSHKNIDGDMKQLRENNISLGKVYSIIGSFFGSMEHIPFTKMSLKTLCGKISREQSDNDVVKTMDVFSKMLEANPDFKYSVLFR